MKTITAENAVVGEMFFTIIDNDVYECKIIESNLHTKTMLVNDDTFVKEKKLDMLIEYNKLGTKYVQKITFSDSQLQTKLPLSKESLFESLYINYYENEV